MKKKFIKLIITSFFMALLFTFESKAMYNDKALLNMQLKITYNSEVKDFFDANGNKVYPITYNDTTYLPVRALSAMFRESIEWNGVYRVIMIGGEDGYIDYGAIGANYNFVPGNLTEISVSIDPNLNIAYKDSLKAFYDVNGVRVYPLIYNDTTYLPVRSISNLFNITIEWIQSTNEIKMTGYQTKYNFYTSEEYDRYNNYYYGSSKKSKHSKDEDDIQNEIVDFYYDYGIFIGTDYSDRSKYKRYQKIVIDADDYTEKEIQSLLDLGHDVYSYINIAYSNDYEDVNDEEWQNDIYERVDDYLSMGITGLFIDGFDVYDEYTNEDTLNGLVEMLKEIKDYGTIVMINGGESFINAYLEKGYKIRKICDEINQEYIYTYYDSENHKYIASSNSWEEHYVSYLKKLQDKNIAIYIHEHTSSSSLEELVEEMCEEFDWLYYIEKE